MNVGVLRAGDTVGNRPQPYILVGAADVSTDHLQRCCKCHMEGALSLIMEDLSPGREGRSEKASGIQMCGSTGAGGAPRLQPGSWLRKQPVQRLRDEKQRLSWRSYGWAGLAGILLNCHVSLI